MNGKRETSGLDILLEVWNRRKWLAVLVFLVPFTCAVILATSLPDLYRSTATLLIEHPRVAETFVKSSVTSELETRLRTISHEILSRSRLQELIARFGLYQEFQKRATLEEVIERMRRDIRMEFKVADPQASHGTTIAFTLSFLGRDPEIVSDMTNTLASLFVEENVRIRERQASGTAEFLHVQLEKMKKKLDQEEGRLGQFKERHVGELPEQMEANLATLQRLNTEMRLNKENQMRVLERLERERLTRQLAEVRASVLDGHAPPLDGEEEALVTRLSRLTQDLTELRSRFSEKYPDVLRVKAEIAALERQLSETKNGESPSPKPDSAANHAAALPRKVHSEAETELNTLKDEEKVLRRAVTMYQRRVDNAPHREQEFQELSRDYKTMKELYNALLQRYQEALVAASMEQGQKGDQFRLLDQAIPSTRPAAPNRLRLFLVGLMLSCMLAASVVALAEHRDTSFHEVGELRTFTKVPVLVSIPRIVTTLDISRRRRQFFIALLGLTVLAGTTYYVTQGNEQLVWMFEWGRS